ncbi:MAG: hypothetical protein IJA14_00850 [Alphaproteobacteria bacterium]|nr:hypothetical protein [Alphaproteobacteria bacterium]
MSADYIFREIFAESSLQTASLFFEKYTNMPLQSFFDSWIDGKIIITND